MGPSRWWVDEIAKKVMLTEQIGVDTAAIDLRHQVVMLGWGSALPITVLCHFEQLKAVFADLS